MNRATDDPIEQAFLDLCALKGVRIQLPAQHKQRVDFYLPDFNLWVEVKAYPCERMVAQLESINAGPNPCMVLIGLQSVHALFALIGA